MSENINEIDWGLKELHSKILEILKYIDDICINQNIEYSLAYGTVLGAIRHGGFIPWDDDADIYMTAKEYEKFRNYFKKYGNHEKFYLQEINAIEGMLSNAKLRVNGTTFIEPLFKERTDMHQGIYIDIFILHHAPKKHIKKRIMCLANQYITLKGLSNRKYKRKKLFIPIFFVMRLFPKMFLIKNCLLELNKYDKFAYDKHSELFDSDLRFYKKSFYSYTTIFPTRRVNFENVELCVPYDFDTYLKHVYGDYLKIPSIDNIKRQQHADIWCVDKDYTEFITK